MKTGASIFMLVALLLTVACSKKEDVRLYKPSDISARVFDSVMTYVRRGEISSQDQFNAARDRFALGLVDSMLEKGLDREEMFERAKILFRSGRKEQGKAALRELGHVEDEIARKAAVEMITMEIEDGAWDNAEELMKEYRKTHPPVPDESVDLWMCVDDLSGRLNNADRPVDAIRVIMDEIDHLPPDYPYQSFSLVEELVPLMIETGRTGELRELTEKIKEDLSRTLQVHLSMPEPADSTAEDYKKLTGGFENNINFLESVLAKLDLIGTKAPSIDILHVFGADSSFTMDRCRGRITVMDFWATWCIACVIGYKELGEIYSDFGKRDLAIVGITRFQGRFSDPESGECVGSNDEPITKDREIELTAGYIEKNRIAWPCVITEKTVMDKAYHIYGLPTYVVLDREGVIRYIQSAVGRQRQMRRVIEKLMGKK